MCKQQELYNNLKWLCWFKCSESKKNIILFNMRRSFKALYVPSQMWNSVGIVRGYNDDQDNAIDVEFHDTAIHHAMHLTNSLGHTMADLSQEAVLLACEGTDELARYKISVIIVDLISLSLDI